MDEMDIENLNSASDLDALIADLTELRAKHGNLRVMVRKDSVDSYHCLDGGPYLTAMDGSPEFVTLDIND